MFRLNLGLYQKLNMISLAVKCSTLQRLRREQEQTFVPGFRTANLFSFLHAVSEPCFFTLGVKDVTLQLNTPSLFIDHKTLPSFITLDMSKRDSLWVLINVLFNADGTFLVPLQPFFFHAYYFLPQGQQIRLIIARVEDWLWREMLTIVSHPSPYQSLSTRSGFCTPKNPNMVIEMTHTFSGERTLLAFSLYPSSALTNTRSALRNSNENSFFDQHVVSYEMDSFAPLPPYWIDYAGLPKQVIKYILYSRFFTN